MMGPKEVNLRPQTLIEVGKKYTVPQLLLATHEMNVWAPMMMTMMMAMAVYGYSNCAVPHTIWLP